MAEGLWNRDTLHFIIELLKSGSSHIRHYQCNDVADDCCEESPEDIVGSKINDRSDKGEMPVVPKVDVDSAGCFGKQHQQVNAQTNRDNKSTDRGVVGNCCCRRPSHVENSQFQSVDFYHFT